MLTFLPAPVVGIIALILYTLNLLITPILIIVLAIPMYLIPFKFVHRPLFKIIHDFIPDTWIRVNNLIMRITTKTQLDVQGTGELDRKGWYLLICNHQSWLDIMILQNIFLRKIPMLKFFMKRELLWTLPVAGLACWILDFPFMKRYSKTYLKKHPERAGQDLEITKKACEKFKNQPITIVNFIEGTRVSAIKQERQASPYKNLLKPKAGGFAFVLAAMSGHLKHIIDTTIIYPDRKTNLWQFMCGRTKKIIVRYHAMPIPPELIGDYFHNKEFRVQMQRWLNQFWLEKDLLIEKIRQQEKS